MPIIPDRLAQYSARSGKKYCIALIQIGDRNFYGTTGARAPPLGDLGSDLSKEIENLSPVLNRVNEFDEPFPLALNQGLNSSLAIS